MENKKQTEIYFDPALTLLTVESGPGKIAGKIEVPFAIKNSADELEPPDKLLARYLMARVGNEGKKENMN